MKNTFFVDLSTLKLTKEQSSTIDKAIQKTVSGELAKFNLKEKIAFVPLEKFKGHLANDLFNQLNHGGVLSGISAEEKRANE